MFHPQSASFVADEGVDVFAVIENGCFISGGQIGNLRDPFPGESVFRRKEIHLHLCAPEIFETAVRSHIEQIPDDDGVPETHGKGGRDLFGGAPVGTVF